MYYGEYGTRPFSCDTCRGLAILSYRGINYYNDANLCNVIYMVHVATELEIIVNLHQIC